MSEENVSKESNVDLKSFKEEILSMNRNLIESLKDDILTQVTSKIESYSTKISNSDPSEMKTIRDEALADIQEEIDELNIDEAQAKALARIVDKKLLKVGSGLKTELYGHVNESITDREVAKEITQKTLMMFPDLKNKNSELFRESKKVLGEMSKVARSAPEAEQIAVERAALRLGVKPLSIRDINAWDAQNPTGGEDTIPKKKDKEIDANLAKLFNVDPKKVNEKLKAKRLQ